MYDEGSTKQVMREIADLYDGDIIVPLPEFQSDERPAIANIARQGINQTAQRIASVFPEIDALPAAASSVSWIRLVLVVGRFMRFMR